MDRLDTLLREEVGRWLERVGGSYAEGTLVALRAQYPHLSGRIDEAEERLASLRAELLKGYRAWRETLVELEDLWGLAALKRETPPPAEEQKSAA